MHKIGLKEKTIALRGEIESYWFDNENINLKKTLFHKITIPLKPFDSGLDYVDQPEKTEFIFDWYKLNIKNFEEIESLNLSSRNYPSSEASIYIGSVHNWCEVEYLKFKSIGNNRFEIKGKIKIDFEIESLAKNEMFSFQTEALLKRN